ncbi:hypothetical protein ACFX2H_011882 [Malus domestica]
MIFNRNTYLCFSNHLIHISLKFIYPESLREESELLLPHRVIHIEHNSRAESGHIELVYLLLAKISLRGLEEVGRNLRTNQESDLLVKQIQCEHTPELRVLFTKQDNGAFQESEQSSEHRPRLHHRRKTLSRSRHN